MTAAPGRSTNPASTSLSEGDGGTADAARSLADRFHGKAIVVDGSTHGADLLEPHPEVIAQVVAFIKSATTDG